MREKIGPIKEKEKSLGFKFSSPHTICAARNPSPTQSTLIILHNRALIAQVGTQFGWLSVWADLGCISSSLQQQFPSCLIRLIPNNM
jgi:hypothetical protein